MTNEQTLVSLQNEILDLQKIVGDSKNYSEAIRKDTAIKIVALQDKVKALVNNGNNGGLNPTHPQYKK